MIAGIWVKMRMCWTAVMSETTLVRKERARLSVKPDRIVVGEMMRLSATAPGNGRSEAPITGPNVVYSAYPERT